MNDNFENINKKELFKSNNNNIDANVISVVKQFDKKYVKEINNLSTLISNFISNINSFILALNKACSALKNQIHISHCLIKEMDEKTEKYAQLNDRMEMINNTSKLFDNHLLIANNKLNIFISEAKKEFKEIKELRIEKFQKIKLIQDLNDVKKFNKSSSRGKIKKNIYESQDNYISSYETYSPHKYENVYNNFIHSSNVQKNNFLDKKINYRKMHFNQSKDNFYSIQNNNSINKKKSSSIIKEKNSRNKFNIMLNNISSRNNSSSKVNHKEIIKNKNIMKNMTTDINSSELKLAYKVLEFIFTINNLQLNKNNNNINIELKNKIESLKNNLMNLTNEVISQNKNNNYYKNRNIINNNFIYNNKENQEFKNNNLMNIEERENISMKLNNLNTKIDKLKAKNQDLELLIKMKDKENQKLNKIIQNEKMFQTFQGNQNFKINNISIEKIPKNSNFNNKYKNNNNIAISLNKKIESLNKSLESIKKQKNLLSNDLISKNKIIKNLKEKINILSNKNKNIDVKIDQKNKIQIFFKSQNTKNELDKQLEELKNKYSILEKNKNGLEKELEEEKKKNEKIDTSEIIKLHNKISEYKTKLSYYQDNFKNQNDPFKINDNNDIINESSKESNDFDIIKETSKEDVLDSELNNNNIIIKNNTNNIDLIKQNKVLKQKIKELQNKINSNNSNKGFDYEKLINNFTKDLKDKDIQIDYLNNQIQKLKTQMKNNKEKENNDVINDKNKKNMNEYESKMNLLKEKNDYFQNNLDSFDDQIKFNEKDIEELKNDIYKTIKKEFKISKIQLCFFAINENKSGKKYSPNEYEILCDKYYYKYQWFLLINKNDKNSKDNDLNKMFWVEKSQLINLDKFNKYISEADETNKNIIKYISKLEEKDDMISKLTYKLNQIEKLNSIEDMNSNSENIRTDKFETIVPLEKYNNLEQKFRKLEEELKLIKLENISLKENFNINKLELDDYNKFEEKLKNGEIQMSENMKKIITNHFNQEKKEEKDDSMDNNYKQSSMEEEENNKITEKNEEENESNEESESPYYKDKDNIINKTSQNKTVIMVRNQLERIKKLYEELEKRLKQIKNAIKNIFSSLVIKDEEKEKEVNKLFEICGFTEEEINEMKLYIE